MKTNMKIDVEKSIIFGSRVDDIKKSLEYLNQEGYFSNSKDFSEYKEGKLDMVHVANFVFSPYEITYDGDIQVFSYFIPKNEVAFVEEELKEKTLRPFKSIKEFFDITGFKIGEVVEIKKFGICSYEETSILNGVRVYTDEDYHRIDLLLDSNARPLKDLFKEFKYYKNGEWLPFGVEE